TSSPSPVRRDRRGSKRPRTPPRLECVQSDCARASSCRHVFRSLRTSSSAQAHSCGQTPASHARFEFLTNGRKSYWSSQRSRGEPMRRRSVRFCLFYDFRNPPAWRQDPPKLYREILDQIVRGEELGWDDAWVSEHHFVDDDYLPSVLTMLAAIAARTMLPLHDPIRVAEAAAVVDVLSAGRLELGFGAG